MSFKDLGLGTGRRLTIVLLATLLLASTTAMLRGARSSGEARDAKTASLNGLKSGSIEYDYYGSGYYDYYKSADDDSTTPVMESAATNGKH